MASTDHTDTVRTQLVGAGISNVYRGYRRETEHLPGDYPYVFVLASGGPAPEGLVNGGGKTRKRPAVQVRIIGQRGARDDTYAVAESVYDALDHISPSGYVSIRPRSSSPNFLGLDSNERPDYSVNVVCEVFE